MRGKNKHQKRKNSSDGSSAHSKNARNGGSNDGVGVGGVGVSSRTSDTVPSDTISDTIRVANSVLYGESVGGMDDSVFETASGGVMDGVQGTSAAPGTPCKGTRVEDSSTLNRSPSNADILRAIEGLGCRMTQMDVKLGKLDVLEEKVTGFESEMKKLWVFVQDRTKENSERVSKVTECVEAVQFSLGEARSEITRLQADRDRMNESIVYMQSQSMRSNLLFSNIPEDDRESSAATEAKLRSFMKEHLKLAQEYVDALQLERVHRVGDTSRDGGNRRGRHRNIVAKFALFKDRETVRRARANLKGSDYYVFEQFPREIAERRKKLVPKLREAIRDKKQAWISYDTLYIDGVPQRGDH